MSTEAQAAERDPSVGASLTERASSDAVAWAKEWGTIVRHVDHDTDAQRTGYNFTSDRFGHMLDAFERNCRARFAATVPGGWKRIETAPKDGRHVLLSDGEHVTVGGWHTDLDHGAEWEGQIGMAGWWTLDWKASNNAPSFWQPLPAAPSVGNTGEGS